MRATLLLPLWLLLCATCALSLRASAGMGAHSGIQTQYFDRAVRPQDDFYAYVNGRWLESTDIPPDRPAYGAAAQLYDDVQRELGGILRAIDTGEVHDSDAVRVRALYQSYLNETRIEQLGAAPLAGELARITALRDRRELPDLLAHLQRIGCVTPISVSVHLDPTDASHYAASLQQDGLGLPDRDYYVAQDATTLRLIRKRYQEYIEASLRLLGDRNPAREATSVLALETALAQAQWDRADSGDPVKTYNRYGMPDLHRLGRNFDWHRYLEALGISSRSEYVIVSEPDFFHAVDEASAHVPLAVWKAYLRWHLLAYYSPFLSRAYADAASQFHEGILQGGRPSDTRERRALQLVDKHLGQALGREFVASRFPEANKLRAEQLMRYLAAAFRQRIADSSWLGPDARAEALKKLDRLTIKVGYPDRWRDYAGLELRSDDLVGNVIRANEFEFDRSIRRLGRPVDHTEWDDSPQTVNAYYNPRMNEIVFPAAILRPPFFDPDSEDAANYGGIGMVMGHELSHAFDEQGAAYDSEGRLRDWWTPEEHAAFHTLVQPLVAEYSGFMPLRGRQIDGLRTLRENVADNAGIAAALDAYHLSLEGRPASLIDGLSGDQRFFMGFAQAWREKIRDNVAIEMIETDSHALSYVRVLGTLLNQPAFYRTFDVEPGDGMYLPPESRVSF